MRVIYSKELLETAVAQNTSFAGVIRTLGLKQAGGTQTHIAKRIRQLGIKTDHFLGRSYQRGKVNPRRKNAHEILIQLPEGSHRQKAHQLVRALKEIGREYRCSGEGCTLESQWLGRPLKLHVDHIDGNALNNLAENLRFLCPNCHSQTETYCKQKGGVVER